MAKWGIWFFVIGRRTLTPDLGENGVKTLVCVCVWLLTCVNLFSSCKFLVSGIKLCTKDENSFQIAKTLANA
jgi:hypothetical protein